MAIYAIHSTALDRDAAAAFDRATVLRLGFALWGFVFGPVWLLAKGLWFAFAAWLLGGAIVGFAIALGVLRPGSGLLLYGLSALFLGVEGRALQGWALARGGRPLADIVSARDSETAEREFLARALHAPPSNAAATAGPSSSGSPEIIGLFPRAGR